MATSVEERRAQFRWMDKLSDEDVTAVPLAEPGTELADLDEYVDATSPKRGRVISLEGERVPVGGVYIVKSASPPELWERIGEAIGEDSLSRRIPCGHGSFCRDAANRLRLRLLRRSSHARADLAPETCHHRQGRIKPYCGKPVMPLSEASADVQQRMLNPLKASKKASKNK